MRSRARLLLSLATQSLLASTAFAQIGVSYIGAAGGFWHVAVNWQPNVIPDNQPGAMPPIYYAATVDRNVLVNGTLFDVAGLTNSSALDVYSSFDFRAAAGTPFLLNTGTVSLVPIVSTSAYIGVPPGQTLTVSGGGIIALGGAGSARMLGGGTLQNNDNTIRGEGSIGEGDMAIANHGVIAATDAGGGNIGTLTVFPNASGLRNDNTLQARNLGCLALRGVIDNGGGNIVADAGGTVQFGLAAVSGGTISCAAGGTIEISNNTEWQSLAHSSVNTRVRDDLTLVGAIDNTGTMIVTSALRIDTEASLDSAGTVVLSGGSINRVGTSDATLTTSNYIRGSGAIGAASLTIINNNGGVIRADTSFAGLSISPSTGGFFNAATLLADGGTLSLGSGDYFNGAGVIRAAPHSSVRLIGCDITGGSLHTQGNGTITIPTATTSRLNGVLVAGHIVAELGSKLQVSGDVNSGPGSLVELRSTMEVMSSASLTIGNVQMTPNAQVTAGIGSFSEGDGPETSPVLYNNGTFTGAGQIGVNMLQIVNNGTITADGGGVGQSNVLTIDPSAKGLVNSGIIQAVDLGQATLTGAGGGVFTQNGTATIRALDAGSNVTLLNAYVSGGIIGAGNGVVVTGGGAITTFESLTTDANVIQSGLGVLQINQTVVNTGSISTNGVASVIVAGNSTLNSGSGYHHNVGTVQISGGGFADFDYIENGSLTGGRLIVTTNGTMQAHSIEQGSLTIQNAAFGTLKSSFTPGANGSIVNNLSIGTMSAALDVTNRGMAVEYAGGTPLSTIAGWITSGYAGGAWTGPGIRSSSAAANPGFGIGFAEASAIGSPATFLGRSIDSTTVVFRYTRYGDANLDAVVSGADFNILATNFGLSGRSWVTGDFTYNGMVNSADFNVLASNFGLGVPSAPGGSVPETGLSAVLGLLLVASRARRRA